MVRIAAFLVVRCRRRWTGPGYGAVRQPVRQFVAAAPARRCPQRIVPVATAAGAVSGPAAPISASILAAPPQARDAPVVNPGAAAAAASRRRYRSADGAGTYGGSAADATRPRRATAGRSAAALQSTSRRNRRTTSPQPDDTIVTEMPHAKDRQQSERWFGLDKITGRTISFDAASAKPCNSVPRRSPRGCVTRGPRPRRPTPMRSSRSTRNDAERRNQTHLHRLDVRLEPGPACRRASDLRCLADRLRFAAADSLSPSRPRRLRLPRACRRRNARVSRRRVSPPRYLQLTPADSAPVTPTIGAD